MTVFDSRIQDRALTVSPLPASRPTAKHTVFARSYMCELGLGYCRSTLCCLKTFALLRLARELSRKFSSSCIFPRNKQFNWYYIKLNYVYNRWRNPDYSCDKSPRVMHCKTQGLWWRFRERIFEWDRQTSRQRISILFNKVSFRLFSRFYSVFLLRNWLNILSSC